MKTRNLSKADIVAQAREKMDLHLVTSERSQRETLALTCQVLFAAGHDSGLAGQITARVPQTEDRFLTQRLGLGFDEITAANLLEVNRDLEVLAIPARVGRLSLQ